MAQATPALTAPWRWTGLGLGLLVMVCSGELAVWLLVAAHAAAHAAAGRILGLPHALWVGWGPVIADRTREDGGGMGLAVLPGFVARPGPAFERAPLWKRLAVLGAGPLGSLVSGLVVAWGLLTLAALVHAEAAGAPRQAGEAALVAGRHLGLVAASFPTVLAGTGQPDALLAPSSFALDQPRVTIPFLLGMMFARATAILTLWNLLPLPWSDGLRASSEVARSVAGRPLPDPVIAGIGAAALAVVLAVMFAMDLLRFAGAH